MLVKSTAVVIALAIGATAMGQHNNPAQEGQQYRDGKMNQSERIDKSDESRTGDRRAGANDANRPLKFKTSKWLSSRDVVNNAGDEIAETSDLIIDRGTGTVTYIVVKSGTTMGLGGREIAIPFGAFTCDAAHENLVLASTSDELKTYPEFSAKNWSAMMESKEAKSDLRRRLATEGSTASDPYGTSLADAQREKIEGTVKEVRRSSGAYGEQTVVVVDTDKGQRTIALGPTWFVNGGNYVPMRGDKVVVNAMTLPRDPNHNAVALNLKSGDKDTLNFREGTGAARWTSDTLDYCGREYCAPYWRYMLGSSLVGADLDCRGTSCGEVESVLIESGSGRIAFLSIDPDEKFLGIGDTKRLIPWQVVSVAHDGKVRVDASKEMVLASQPTPKDLESFSASGTSDEVYRAFQVERPQFPTVATRTSSTSDDLNRPATGRK